VSATITGDANIIPKANSTDTTVLYATADGKTKSQIIVVPPQYTIASTSIVSVVTLTFEVVSLGAPVTIEILAVDSDQVVVGRVTVDVLKVGSLPVDVSKLFIARRFRQIVIGGKAITFTMNVLTPNVPIEVSKSATSVSLAVVSPATTKQPSLSSARSLQVSLLTYIVLAFLLFMD
jgi:hypothetical protein